MRKQGVGKDKQNEIGKFIVEVECKKAEWLEKFYPKGVRSDNRNSTVATNATVEKSAGLVSQPAKMPAKSHESANARIIYNEPELKEAAIAKIIESNKIITPTLVATEIRKQIKANENFDKKPTPMPDGLFDVIYADPPWLYDFYVAGTRSIQSHYPVMSDEQIANLEIPFAENCVLFLWATAPKLENALYIMKHWGFEYKSCCVWDKQKIGMGYWFRGQHEILLVGVKGKYSPPEESVRESSFYSEKRGQHSKKPDYYYTLIEKYFPNGKYLELFARQKYNDKWSIYGNEI
jgi:N6-adenosine-specific RNA methylase IME4